jgi:YYY domain-containing protein
MTAVISWYLIVAAFGWLAWPLAFRLLPGLADRGYTLSRVLGLLLTGFTFWLLGSLGLLRNTVGGMLFSALPVLGASLWAYSGRPNRDDTLGKWLKSHLKLVFIAEALFLIAFAGWAVVRAYNPDLSGTEKPMELAFLNGIRLSETFPPHDPWLAGYAISYYYFGYVIIAMLADLSGVITSVAFNLGIALLFALTLLGAYGLIYNLLAAPQEQGAVLRGPQRLSLAPFSALLGPLCVGILGNLAGLLELLRSLRLLGPGFWDWLDIQDLSDPLDRVLWPPDQWRYWWWWRGSRVIHDRTVAGVSIGLQPIDEFPFFSFLLGDMHPHVLALPFVMLALGLAFNLLAQREQPSKAQLMLYAICFGGLAFLNTWDLPIYLFVLIGALVLRRVRERGSFDWADLGRPVLTGLVILVVGIAAYLPWYISFSSQAGGILPNAIFPTRLHQFLVMFAPFLIVIVWFVLDSVVRLHHRADWLAGVLVGAGLLIALVGLMVVLGASAIRVEPLVRAFVVSSVGINVEGLSDQAVVAYIPEAVRSIALHRLTHPLTALTLTALIVVVAACVLSRPLPVSPDESNGQPEPPFSASVGFALLLILTGALLTLGPEFVYLRDNFGQRLNTIFKFYYAAWVVWGIAAAYAAHVLLSRPRLAFRTAFAVVLTVLALSGLVYPIFAIPAKTGGFVRTADQPSPTLDGINYIRLTYPSDYNGIRWLQENADPDAIVLEAVGGAYSYYGRVSSATGLQTLIGWANHERQWRGELYSLLAGTREMDANEIYTTTSIQRAWDLLTRYDVTYVFVGSLERALAPNGIYKFDRFLTAVYRDGDVVIYRADLPLVEVQP